MKPERIAKRMAALGLCSRREAERWIADGRVAVNGKTLETPATLVSEEDVIAVDGKTITNESLRPRLWKYHKPVGMVTTHSDPQGRPTVFDNLPKHLPRVISIGRLDLNSEGLLLLTTSGELSRALELPKNALKREYRVRVNGTPTDRQLARLAQGMVVDGMQYQPIRAKLEKAKTDGRNRWLDVVLTEGKNREIRRVFDHLDLPVSRLIRISYGAFALDALKVGAVEEVPGWQVEKLMGALARGGEDAPATAPPRSLRSGSAFGLRTPTSKRGKES